MQAGNKIFFDFIAPCAAVHQMCADNEDGDGADDLIGFNRQRLLSQTCWAAIVKLTRIECFQIKRRNWETFLQKKNVDEHSVSIVW